MPSPLVLTKLYIPPVRRDLVPRPRLEHLREQGTAGLTVVSAPPGFGKSTLLASWVDAARAAGRAVAWVSLEATDQQPESFWAYVLTALDDAAPGVATGALALLGSGHPSPIETVLTLLVNELGAHTDGLDLFLDDYHLADGPGIADDVAFLLPHLPPHVRVVIGTRADPALPLARLRARGELVEVRAADLRFTLAEAASYLRGVVGLDLEPADVSALQGRTEGWVAALQLAGLSLRGREDAAGFIAGFAGDDRYVVDYLVEEVIGRQPAAVRRFLLDTSVLERFTGSLCDAVTGGDDGRRVIEQLERANLFVVPLDDTRQWYRYHHLFAEVLRAHLVDERPRDVVELHGRAARWCAEHGERGPAVGHALAAGDVELAADVVERAAIGMLRDRQESTVLRWVEQIPDDVVRRRPVLAVAFIGALMSGGRLEGVTQRLDTLEAVVADPPPGTVVLDESELPRLPGAMATYRAALALVGGQPEQAIAHADRAVALAAPGDDLTVAAGSALSGLAHWGSGDLLAAQRSYTTAVGGLRRAGNYSDVLGCSITLGDLLVTQGRLGDALGVYEGALRLAAGHEVGGPLRGTADMVLGLAEIAFERGDLETTRAHLRRLDQLGEPGGLPQHPYRWRAARARLLEAEGDLAGAVALLEEAGRVYVGDFSPDVRPVASRRSRVLLAQGRLGEALDWARGAGVTPDDELSYVREHEHVTLARILLHQHAAGGSLPAVRASYGLLERLGVAAQEGGRTGSLIEVLALHALSHHALHGRHDVPGALALLGRALRLAEPEGYVRLFVGEGPPMVTLLEALARQDPSWAYPRRLAEPARIAKAVVAQQVQGIVDPLSPRELDVLRLLATDLDGPGIARELVVSLNTVRTHTKSIYAKLGVTNRRAALTRATELQLLTRPR